MKITESKLRRIIRKAITEYGGRTEWHNSPSNYSGRYGAGGGSHERGHGNYEYDDDEAAEREEAKREQLGRLHASLRKMYAENPDQSVMSVVRTMLDQWDRSFEEEIKNYWTMLQR
tara:strand:- start:213 stop:560 length:348 start_codon:yes stop_codon:yes gene_type:complete